MLFASCSIKVENISVWQFQQPCEVRMIPSKAERTIVKRLSFILTSECEIEVSTFDRKITCRHHPFATVQIWRIGRLTSSKLRSQISFRLFAVDPVHS